MLSPNDEFADYETWDKSNLNGTEAKQHDMLQYEYTREALNNGLKLEQQLGGELRKASGGNPPSFLFATLDGIRSAALRSQDDAQRPDDDAGTRLYEPDLVYSGHVIQKPLPALQPRIRSWAWSYREIPVCRNAASQARRRSQVMVWAAFGRAAFGNTLAKSDNADLACWDFSRNNAAVFHSPNE
jgi:hypothetical protein